MKTRLLICFFLILVVLILIGCGLADRPLVREEALPAYARKTDSSDPVNTPTVHTEAEPVANLAPEDPGWYMVIADDTLTHSEPSASRSTRTGSLRKGVTVKKLDEQGSFMQVDYNGYVVWVHKWLLASMDADYEEIRQTEHFKALTSRSGYEPLDEPKEMFSMANSLNCREEPNTDSASLDQLILGDSVTVYGTEGKFYLVKTANGRLCYCASAYFTDEFRFAYLESAVDLRALMPDAEFDLLFASNRNITGHAMYPAVPLLEKTTAAHLYEAYKKFKEDGYVIKIYDAYRPFSAQVQLYDIVQDSRFIANPDRGGSWHQHGRAVDMSLVDIATGEELEMPTPMHTFAVSASRYNRQNWTEAARANVDYMTGVMTAAGFGTISTEWWHYEYLGPGGHMPSELNYSKIDYRPISEFTWP